MSSSPVCLGMPFSHREGLSSASSTFFFQVHCRTVNSWEVQQRVLSASSWPDPGFQVRIFGMLVKGQSHSECIPRTSPSPAVRLSGKGEEKLTFPHVCSCICDWQQVFPRLNTFSVSIFKCGGVCVWGGLAVWVCLCTWLWVRAEAKVNVGNYPLSYSLRQNLQSNPSLPTFHLAGQLALQMEPHLCFLRLELQASCYVGSGVWTLVLILLTTEPSPQPKIQFSNSKTP